MAGKGGAPKGNKNSATGKEGRIALLQALDVASGNKKTVLTRYKALVQMWDKQIEAALDGDKDAMRMIVERTDGRPHQAIDVNAEVSQRMTVIRKDLSGGGSE